MREAYNLFNEISDQLYGSENCKDNSGENQKTEDDAGDEEEENEDEDIDAAFEKEKTELTEMGKKTASGERRFQVQRRVAGLRELIRDVQGCREWCKKLCLHQDYLRGAA